MRKSRFTETQIVAILKEADAGLPVNELCRKHGISTATYYNWKSKYGGLEASELKRIKELEAENQRLKQMFADLSLENRAMKDLIDPKALGPSEKREAVHFLVEEHRLPITRSCRCVGLSRAAYYRTPIAPQVRDAEVIAALQELAEKHPTQGFWKYQSKLRRRGYRWNHKRVYRVYCAMKLNHKRRVKRRVPPRERQPLDVPDKPNAVWSADFVSDALYCGRRFRTFNVLDDFNREAVTIEIDTSITSQRLVRVFEQLKAERGLPEILRTDNGPEFLGDVFTRWARENGMLIQYIQPGKPNQNAYIERFNRTYRDEVLDLYLFEDLDQVREITHRWMIEYNEERPHDALGERTPLEHFTHYAMGSSLEVST
ncbi:IS3 family transposase [Alkalilimnicola sp. S0819]|uniref:IS3 family transposase n=1 Tax=Alkalilimnicola sp. S0819 TaxID=2613922 RepID=UPI0012618A9E|nr:IS3 family transposase [Alkalilimnicola sp. S0819]KAB7619409.1 IS3 family transposase [Alkalilimnicola sp. S0819]MPQ17717.1 IS3 family transposase [Alkalilimnicola sp. S0819]